MPTHRTLKFHVGDWVIVTLREPGRERDLAGKIVEADRDGAIAACRTREGERRYIWNDDTDAIGSPGGVSLRRMTQADWAARKRRRAA